MCNASNQELNYGTVGEVKLLQAGFQKAANPSGHLVLQALFPPGGDFRELIDPVFTLPQNQRYSFSTLSALFRYANTCKRDHLNKYKDSDATLEKSWRWLRFKCEEDSKLPTDFFERSPFIFALGGSYAFLATQNAERLKINQEWIQNHLHFFHISELRNLPPSVVNGGIL
jgi:hypothetical protein